jgi:hypothetical protein
MMEYNSQRKKLQYPEYGRNVQKMIDVVMKIEDKHERNVAVRTVINVMASMNPGEKDSEDYAHKLWDHLHIITNFALDVDSPYEKPDPDMVEAKPKKMAYPKKNIEYLHYGSIIGKLIKKASEMPDSEDRDVFVVDIANLMKKAYLNWNRDSVSDELIRDQLEELSNGKLTLKEHQRLVSTHDILGQQKKAQESRANAPGSGKSKKKKKRKNPDSYHRPKN